MELISKAAKTIIFLLQLDICYSIDLRYERKILGNRKDDGFGFTMDAHNGTLIVGAPDGHHQSPGSVRIFQENRSTKISGPPQGQYYGVAVAVNDNYFVVSGRNPEFIYIRSVHSPYELTARIPVEAGASVFDVAISENNMIAVVLYGDSVSALLVYQYTGMASWHLDKTWPFIDEYAESLSVSGGKIVVGVPHSDRNRGRVMVYSKVDGEWRDSRLKPLHSTLTYFGSSAEIDSDRVVVSSSDGNHEEHIWVYRYHGDSDQWILEGHIAPLKRGLLAINSGVIAVVAHDYTSSSALGEVYKYLKGTWVKCVNLSADPMMVDQLNRKVRIDGDKVLTSRASRRGFGVVYVHDLSQIH